MRHFSMLLFSTAMIVFTVVSMWTTYKSLTDSILPGPVFPLPITGGLVWDVAWPALGLSVAVGMMLLGLKFAIIYEKRKLGIPGFVGLFLIAFISISFNLDVLYRTANQDFHLQYTDKQMRAVYEPYLAEVQRELRDRELAVKRDLARQRGELESEIEGLRQAPAGFGNRARAEQYQLNLLEREAEVELTDIEESLAAKAKADALLATTFPQSVAEIEELEKELRVLVMAAGAGLELPMPPPMRSESPFFAVFSNLFDYRTAGFQEVFFLLIAVMLDLGDIVGFNLVTRRASLRAEPMSASRGYRPAPYIPEQIAYDREPQTQSREVAAQAAITESNPVQSENETSPTASGDPPRRAARPVRFRGRRR